ncbi:cytochrome c biogenesis protein CcdA [uncultured Rossellomorea sp.]|uniref:cytochrome c biogenesis CcdA family protein n=1 Tax=uncultured Rossellomorea sp. TaxID=2837549 RepID=UPI00342A8B04
MSQSSCLENLDFNIIKEILHYLNSLLVGIFFAAGWTPCVGPIFGSIMYANMVNPTQTFLNITAYSLGSCIPFIIMELFIGESKNVFEVFHHPHEN